MKPPAPMEDAPQPLVSRGVDGLLMGWETADAEARARAIALMYPELKRLAEIHMHRERHDHTLQPTALVNEFFLQMARQQSFRCRNRAHFVAIASRAMRRLLVDYSRAHTADKRGGGAPKVQMDGMEAVPAKVFDILEINEALDQLAAEEPRMARVVELRCFGGLAYSGDCRGSGSRRADRQAGLAGSPSLAVRPASKRELRCGPRNGNRLRPSSRLRSTWRNPTGKRTWNRPAAATRSFAAPSANSSPTTWKPRSS